MLAGHAEEAVRVGFEALQLAEELGLDDLRAHALTNIGVARTMMGDRGGVADLERSVAISAETNSPESVRGFLNLGSTYAELGDLRKAFDVHAAGRRMAERFADAGGMRWFAAERVFERYWRGQWEDAARLADDLIDESAGDGRHYSEYSSRIVRGWIRLARGELEPALDDAAHALDFARQAADVQALHPALAFRARVLLAAGRTDDARALADELVRTWTGGGPLVVSFWVADLAPVLLGAGSPRELLGAAAATPIRTRWLDAAAAFAAGEFERAATLYSEIGTRPDEAFARLRAAERLVEAGDRDYADRELARAAAFYRSVGATAYLREVESLLASV